MKMIKGQGKLFSTHLFSVAKKIRVLKSALGFENDFVHEKTVKKRL
jgi:hypothetical protein